MNILKTIVSLTLFLVALFYGTQIIKHAKLNQSYKMDYAEINHFKYGLFSVNAWREKLTIIIGQELDKISLTKENEKVVRKQLERQLSILIDKVMEKIKKDTYDTPQGQLKYGIFKGLVDVEEIKKGTPIYAEAILEELKKSKTQNEIKGLIKEKINYYLTQSFDAFDETSIRYILKKTSSKDVEEAKQKLNKGIYDEHKTIRQYSMVLMMIAIVIFLIEGLNKKPLPQIQFFILTLTLVILLATGVTTPMIDMEAKITAFKFTLFGHPIEFTDQVLYFQSKSIQDVFWVMITHKEIQMKLVGILIVCFSIVFPVFKILSSLVYYYDYCGARKFKLINFFVLKSGKWTMADVMVVAIFMAYIGFNGIINGQMADLRTTGEAVNVLTTNGTNLQPGFYLFLLYVILAMFLSGFIHARPYVCKTNQD